MAITSSCGALGILPPELRLIIYEYVLRRGATINPHGFHSRQELKRKPRKKRRCAARPSPFYGVPFLPTSLLRTCRQIYREALPILYSTNAIVISPPCAPYSEKGHILTRMFRHLPPGYLPIIVCCVVDAEREVTIERLAHLKRLWERPTYSRKNVVVCVVADQGMHSSQELLKEAWGDVERDKALLRPISCGGVWRMGYLNGLKCKMDESEDDWAGWMKKFPR